MAHQGRQQAHRVGGAAGAGIVLHVGQHDRLARRRRQLDGAKGGGVGIEKLAVEGLLLGLHSLGKLVGGRFDSFLVVAVDHQRRAALGDVGRREARRVGDADDALVVTLLAGFELAHQVEDGLGGFDEGALPDQRDQEIELAIGAIDRPLVLEQAVEQLDGALAGHRHVDVRIGAIADQRRGEPGHLGREVGVIVEAGHDRQVVAHDVADAAQQLAFAVLGVLGHHRAVQVEIDGVERAELAKILVEQRPHPLVGILGHVRGRRRRRPGQRHDLVAKFGKALDGARDRDVEAFDSLDHFRPAQKRRPGIGAHEFLPGRLLRRKSIGLVLKSAHSNSRHRTLLPFTTPFRDRTIASRCARSCLS